MRDGSDRVRLSGVLAVVCAVVLFASACGGGGGEPVSEPSAGLSDEEAGVGDDLSQGSGEAGVSGEAPAPVESVEPLGAPHVAELPWGDFALASRIVDKLASGERLNFVLSVEATGIGGSGEVLGLGWSGGAGEFDADINARVVGPNNPDASVQVETIDSLIAAGSIDCLAVEAGDPGLFAGVIGQAVDAGIPVFTVGGDSPDSKRFAFFGYDDRAVGKLVGVTVGDWAAENRLLMRKAGVLAGDAEDLRLRARMEGFVEGLLEVHSGIEFVNDPTTTESVGFDPQEAYAAAHEWLVSHSLVEVYNEGTDDEFEVQRSDLDVVFHADSGLEVLAQAIADESLYGDVYAAGFAVSERISNAIRDGVVAAAVSSGRFGQARQAAEACGDFLLSGLYPTGAVFTEPLIVTRDNVEAIDLALPENQ